LNAIKIENNYSALNIESTSPVLEFLNSGFSLFLESVKQLILKGDKVTDYLVQNNVKIGNLLTEYNAQVRHLKQSLIDIVKKSGPSFDYHRK